MQGCQCPLKQRWHSTLERPLGRRAPLHPEPVALQLQLRELERREVVLADDRRRRVPYMAPVEVRFANRRCFTGAMVLGDEVLLGTIPIEDMDLVLRLN
jgi:hypothetical protein